MFCMISVIIVTHNSAKFLPKCLASLKAQSVSHEIVIVDSGSVDPSYLDGYDNVIKTSNIGFCAANNLGFTKASSEFVLFLNPDAFLSPNFLADALHLMEKYPQCGALTGSLLGYDFDHDRPTGKYDSTGIFSTWYGKWYDRDQGKPVSEITYHNMESVPAICGALMFCRKKALTHPVFDPTFYMYKEDIDLSLRLRAKGWDLLFFPKLIAYHGRGWKKRSQIPRQFRLFSARNEIKINKVSLLKLPYSLVKYAAVKVLNW